MNESKSGTEMQELLGLVESLAGKIDGIDKRIGDIDKRIEGVGTKIEGIDNRIGDVKTTMTNGFEAANMTLGNMLGFLDRKDLEVRYGRNYTRNTY